eukprot:CAMPEP_0197027098 /NCGR_PEP_ID=MMETSP1384-20130603/7073_1 /TAXON_ID=29189 /ORGANISM="Ammonia sp." /LENGTH=797 /DNA_ID=CAMNT_0042455895 /DNA_START=21 /DNA_END=2414 /DNA_ORIENTATION=-
MVDLAVFHEPYSELDECDDIKSCIALKRLMTSLRYYAVLKVRKEANGLAIFEDFVFNTYQKVPLINDYVHVRAKHGAQIADIQRYFVETVKLFPAACNISRCQYTSRHQQVKQDANSPNKIALSSTTHFYAVLLDSIHFYIFHIFDVGLRVPPQENQVQPADDMKEEDANRHYDAVFARKTQEIEQRQAATKAFDRFNAGKNAKFNIQVDSNESVSIAAQSNNDKTNLDKLYVYLHRSRVHQEVIAKLHQILVDEEYDTDAMDDDFNRGKDDGNISVALDASKCVVCMKRVLLSLHASMSAFATGCRFYYWPKFKHLEQLPHDKEMAYNVNDHGGYKVFDLYVEKKWNSFKEEICHYPEPFDLQHYNEVVRVKAMEFLQSNPVKRIRSSVDDEIDGSLVDYGVADGAAMSYPNVVCLILYCDETELSRDFSLTFRKKHAFETLEQVKQRNRAYYWWSKILRETVELFGKNYFVDNGRSLGGPLYTGISCVLNITQFTMRLSGPTSTTKQQEVAVSFAKSNGMIMQLNNDEGLAKFGRAFDCSWLSKYGEEDERLFFGGYYVINVEALYILKTNQKFEALVDAMCYLDKMVNGDSLCTHSLSDHRAKLLCHLIAVTLGESVDEEAMFDPYILSSFKQYIESKKHIQLDLDDIYDSGHQMVKDIMLHTMEKRAVDEVKQCAIRKATDLVNLPQSAILKIFRDVQHLTIRTTYAGGAHFYSFSLLSLLNCISGSMVRRVEIKADVDGYDGHGECWLDVLWADEKRRSEIVSAFKDAKYNIALVAELMGEDQRERWCIISK